MKNVTFSAQDDQITQARELAQARGTTLNEEFRAWLQRYINQQGQDEKQASVRRLIDTIAAPTPSESAAKPYATPSSAPVREALNEREARMLKRLDAGQQA